MKLYINTVRKCTEWKSVWRLLTVTLKQEPLNPVYYECFSQFRIDYQI